LSEFSGGSLCVENFGHWQANMQHAFRDTGELRKTRVPLDKAKISIEHHDAVGHAGKDHFETLSLGRIGEARLL
jgi:hypothetical protein